MDLTHSVPWATCAERSRREKPGDIIYPKHVARSWSLVKHYNIYKPNECLEKLAAPNESGALDLAVFGELVMCVVVACSYLQRLIHQQGACNSSPFVP